MIASAKSRFTSIRAGVFQRTNFRLRAAAIADLSASAHPDATRAPADVHAPAPGRTSAPGATDPASSLNPFSKSVFFPAPQTPPPVSRASVAKQIKDAGSAGARSEQASQLDSFAPRAKRDSGERSARERPRTPICAATLVGVSFAFILLAAPSAQAAFLPATPPSFATPGSEAGQLSGPTAVATNDTTHDVYVADPGNARIDQFAQDGTFIRAFGWNVVASGPGKVTTGLSNEVQTLTLKATTGTYTLSFEGEPSAAIPFDATAAEVQVALEAIPALGAGNVAVTGPAAGSYAIEFTAAKAEVDVAELTPDPTNLLNGEEPGTATVATTIPGGGALEFCEPANGDACQAGLPGTGPGELQNPVGIAVDNSAGSSAEDIYVADSNRILKFGPSGSFLSANNGSGAPGGAFTGLAAIAADGSGDLWSADSATGKVDEFNPSGTYVPGSEFADGYASTTAIAVDSGATKVYLMNGDNHGATEAWDPAEPATKPALIDDGGSAYAKGAFKVYAGLSLAVDLTSGDLYVADFADAFGPSFEITSYATVIRYDAAGTQIEQFGGEGAIAAAEVAPFSFAPLSQGIAFDPTASHPGSAPGALYAVENPNSDLRIFAPPPRIPPTIESTGAVKVTATSADLRAQVNPNFYDTHAHFEYTTTDFANCGEPTNPACLTSADTDLGAAGTGQPLTAHLSALAPETTYRYRVLADNGNAGPQVGPQRSLTTSASNPSFALPDNRAYEMVSPLDKNGGEVHSPSDQVNLGGVSQAAPDGDAITFDSTASFAEPGSPDPLGSPPRSQYISRRGEHGWVTQNITSPVRSAENPYVGFGGPYKIFSSDLTAGLQFRGQVPQSTPFTPNLYRYDALKGTYQPLITSLPLGANGEPIPTFAAGGDNYALYVAGASEDLSHVVVETEAVLTDGANYQGNGEFINNVFNIYEWSESDGEFHAVNVLPGVINGETAQNSLVGSGEYETNAISSDGSRIAWTSVGGAEPAARRLFVRLDADAPDAHTVQVDAAEPGAAGPSGEGEFRTSSLDGSKVFFTDRWRLTADSTANNFPNGADLYEFDVETGHLRDLSVDSNPADLNRAAVKGVLGASADGSYLYFVAGGTFGEEVNEYGDSPTPEGANLYVAHGGSVRFITSLAANSNVDEHDWRRNPYVRTSRVSPDGKTVVFNSLGQLTGYDNSGCSGACSEVYAYSAASNHLVCVSCNPSGAAPLGDSSIPPGTVAEAGASFRQPRVLSYDGARVFFNSSDALVPQDTNGTRDVYEYENGAPHLISSGTGRSPSEFVDASADGRDVFFITPQQLVPRDTDELTDLYDARENGGFPEPPTQAACEGDACHVNPTAPSEPTLSTSVTGGPGNATECAKGKVVKKGKCVKKKSNKKHKGKKHNRSRNQVSKRSAHNNRRAHR